MILSGSIHAVVDAIIKGGADKAAGRAAIDTTSALVLLPALLLVSAPGPAWPWLGASAVIHVGYLYALAWSVLTGLAIAAYTVVDAAGVRARRPPTATSRGCSS